MSVDSTLLLKLYENFLQAIGVQSDPASEETEQADSNMALDVLGQEIFLNDKPQIGLIGKVRAGKSTLGNAIFSKDAFETGDGLELTQEVRKTTLPSGIVICDSPGFAGFSNHDKNVYDLMTNCDIILYVVRYPGQLDQSAVELYKKEIEPTAKLVITVINMDESVSEDDAKKVTEQFKIKGSLLPNVTFVYALHGRYVQDLLLQIVDILPAKYQVVFSSALDERFRRLTRRYIVYRLSIYSAAAACSSVIEEFSDKAIKQKVNKITMIAAGLPLKIANVYGSDFDITDEIRRSTREVADRRYETIISEHRSGPAMTLGATMSAVITSIASHTPVVAAAIAAAGIAAAPVTLGLAAAGAAAAGALVASSLSKSFRMSKKPKLGGYDIALTILALGYTTLDIITGLKAGTVAAADSNSHFSKTFKDNLDLTMRDTIDAAMKDRLENATEGDRVKIGCMLMDNEELHKLFVPR